MFIMDCRYASSDLVANNMCLHNDNRNSSCVSLQARSEPNELMPSLTPPACPNFPRMLEIKACCHPEQQYGRIIQYEAKCHTNRLMDYADSETFMGDLCRS